MTANDVERLELVRSFVFLEARLCDEHSYGEWEALWTDDALYWVPAGSDSPDPSKTVSIIYDSRARIATRVRQLSTGERWAQEPASRLRRVLGNVELVGELEGDLLVEANFLLYELRSGQTTLWGGRTAYRLRPEGDRLRMVTKKVMLMDNRQDIPTMAFLI